MGVIRQPNISEVVARHVRQLIVDGDLADGARINEVRLAERLEVSRTPVREGLMRLSSEGWVEVAPRFGFFVQSLSVTAFDEIYPIRAMLDPEALRLAGTPDRERLEELRRLEGSIETASSAADAVRLDNQWHMALVTGCPNLMLLELIAQFQQRTMRYELALLRETPARVRMGQDHRKILEALGRDDLPGACTALRRNMESGVEPIRIWLRSRPSPATHRAEDAS